MGQFAMPVTYPPPRDQDKAPGEASQAKTKRAWVPPIILP